MRHHLAGDHMTKITAIAPGGDCPQWLAFLKTITNCDKERQTFLQRVAGYCLTGSTREHALFFGYGTGGNGKGVFLNTLTGLMNDYASVAGMETFTASSSDRHPTDLAMLRGARLVTAQETEEGRKWAESRIKAMTGGDPITARFMRQDFFTFLPNFKLFIAGNHKPGLRSVDEAIRRRMNLFRENPSRSKRPGTSRKTEGRMARYSEMDDRGMSRMAAERACRANGRHRCHERIFRDRGRAGDLAEGMLRHRQIVL
jgi:putative DNA primase/helicase